MLCFAFDKNNFSLERKAFYLSHSSFTHLSIHPLFSCLMLNTFVCSFKSNDILMRLSDISYIRLKNGFAYLCAIIDLHTRAIISHRLSNTTDDNLVASTIEDALYKHKNQKSSTQTKEVKYFKQSDKFT